MCKLSADREAVRPKGANKVAGAVCALHAPSAVCGANRIAPFGRDKRPEQMHKLTRGPQERAEYANCVEPAEGG